MTVAEVTLAPNGQKMVDITGPDVIVSINPATGQKLGEVQTATPEQIRAIMQRARLAQEPWAQLGLRRRLALIRSLKDSLYRNMDLITNTIVAEQGRPPFEALVEFWPTIELLAYYLRTAERTLAPRRTFVSLVPHRMHWTERHPHGVVLVISPWNFPLLLSATPIVAALIAGNTVVYKPSEFATRSGDVLAKVIGDAGFPPDVFQIVHGRGDVGAALIRERPDKICFTGSVATGRKIAAAAGERLIPVTLELGGKDAAIVLEDANLDRTAAGVAWAGMINAGQVCASVERVYVMRPVADKLVEKMAKVINDYVRLGPGESSGSTMGAITTDAQLRIISSQVQEAVAQGARVVAGGHMAEDKGGRFYVPTLITDVTPDMRVVKDETFGPVIAVVPVDSEEEALELANASNFGLTGSVWTRNRARGVALARRMQVGTASVNDHLMSASVPNMPWGGVKDSGFGRTRGREGLLDMTTSQSLSIERLAPLPREFFWYPYKPIKGKLLRRVLRLLYAPTWGERLRALLP
jgi:acyl-CoA reductase-like NAD-dependent aldehyde dehydrogenase